MKNIKKDNNEILGESLMEPVVLVSEALSSTFQTSKGQNSLSWSCACLQKLFLRGCDLSLMKSGLIDWFSFEHV